MITAKISRSRRRAPMGKALMTQFDRRKTDKRENEIPQKRGLPAAEERENAA
jgi:hypothetical protein